MIAVVGSTGFIGRACVDRLRLNTTVVPVTAPRLRPFTTSLHDLRGAVLPDQAADFAYAHFQGVDIVINAAGLADATSGNFRDLVGANSVTPLFLLKAAQIAGVRRFVHISSAAVQGTGYLDETERLEPGSSPYGISKALGELLLRDEATIELIRYRPTSVHGADRPVTRSLSQLAASGLAFVAAPGDDPTPQTSVARVSAVVEFLSRESVKPPGAVAHPWEGVTTSRFLRELSGREPRSLNRSASRFAVKTARSLGQLGPAAGGNARRLEMMLFGQRQTPGWLTQHSQSIEPIEPGWLVKIREALREGTVGGGDR